MYQRVCLLGPRFPEQLSPVSTVLSHLPRVSREGNYFAHVLSWVRWLEDAPERRGCGGGGGGGRIGNGARVERRRRRRAGPNGVNSPGGGGGGGQDPEGEAAAEPGSRLRWKPGLSAAEGFCGGRERTP
uniref:Histone-lysine N-methyltransferase 2A-like isoform X3 n=1 Tax=Tursiops truncatus TaxID=9739 RepID=A0A6J3QAD2_TURTR|nr:histone-lysine N-methyltransferase 2A-like isoform X3 [Tursiops truncatus]XP_033699068.1 histone-lysine N-methyltransferase 2A-like isoform X3 [Tursiops truncatus]